jgi:hypothetical protein
MRVLLAVCSFAAELEAGAVTRSDGGAFHRNMIPQIARQEFRRTAGA